MDSTVLLYDAIYSGHEVPIAVSFNYGQRHKKELKYAAATCEALKVKHVVIDLYRSGITSIFGHSGSSLVDSNVDVPEGHYAQENMKVTVVPNRNMIMLAIAGGIAVAEGAQAVGTAVHAGDHFIYPDCRPEFIGHLNKALLEGNAGFGNLGPSNALWTPYIHRSKAWIAERGIYIAPKGGFPFEETWSCYKGDRNHCGRCGTCVERLEAINEACMRLGLNAEDVDHTKYDDDVFWAKQVGANG